MTKNKNKATTETSVVHVSTDPFDSSITVIKKTTLLTMKNTSTTTNTKKSMIDNDQTHYTEERNKIRDFWLQLSQEKRRLLVKVEKETVLRKLKGEQPKHVCNCSVCGKKRIAIEDELETLYDAYYNELEKYAYRQQQRKRTCCKKGAITVSTSHPKQRRQQQQEGEETDTEEDDNDSIITKSVFDDSDLCNDTTSVLTVNNSALTLADDLMKNNGQKFLDMMEQLNEQKMNKEQDMLLDNSESVCDEEDDEEEFTDDDDDDDESKIGEAIHTKKRMQEGRKMFQMFAARMFEQRVLAAYREKVAQDRQRTLIEELEQEKTQRQERELQKKLEKERKRVAKRALKEQQEKERIELEDKRKNEEIQRSEAERQLKEQERLEKEKERREREADRVQKMCEKRRQIKEEKKMKRKEEERTEKARLEQKISDRDEKHITGSLPVKEDVDLSFFSSYLYGQPIRETTSTSNSNNSVHSNGWTPLNDLSNDVHNQLFNGSLPIITTIPDKQHSKHE